MKRTACKPPLVVVAWLLCALPAGCRDDAPPGYTPSHPAAHYLDVARVEFDDGDTFFVDGHPIRLLGVDTPETRDPNVGIMTDQPFGPAATESTRTLMTRARVVELAVDGRDRYGRRLGHVWVDGELLAVRLLRMGLAYENVSHFGDNGFPDLAQQILDASLVAPKPQFQEPYKWRRKNQKRRR